MIRRKYPAARVLIIEKNAAFDRKVGESTTEVSSCYMTRILGLTNYLGHEQLAKQGLRMWFCNSTEQRFDDCVEIVPRYNARVQTFQVDRAKLDSHLLQCAANAGSELWRPAKVAKIELKGANGQAVDVDLGQRSVRARWLIDASGRATLLARKLGHYRPNNEHPINAVWARFTGVKDWDSYDWREKFRDYMDACRTARSWATNHLMGYGWGCWIIPLRGGDVSAGIVYDSRIFDLPAGATLAQRLHHHLISHPVGHAIFGRAQAIEGDVHAFSALPYWSEKVCGDGWAAVGDATSFIDPLYSPGLDFCSFTSYYVGTLLSRSLAGENVRALLDYYNAQYPVTYRKWFESLYQDKYFFMGEADLMSAALLLDVASYYIGIVRPVYRDPECAFARLPFEGRPGRLAASMMKFYRRRLVALAKNRAAAGRLGEVNSGWRELYDGFVPDFRLRKQIAQGLRRWWSAEWKNLAMSPRRARSATATASAHPAEV